MKPRNLIIPLALTLCTTAIHAGTVGTTFSFQQGDLRQDGELYGSGASYNGVLDGHLVDANTTTTLTAGATATIGNQWQSQTTPPAANGRNFVSLFSYDLTELSDFIAANTSANSSVAITSVSFTVIASGNTVGGAHAGIGLYRTDPFTAGATWPTTDGTTAWSVPYQSSLAESQFRYTGGGSALTANLGSSSPSTGSKTAGSVMKWTSSTGFIDALTHALGQEDKKLYLMAARGLQNSDGRVPVNTSNATTVDDRPELVIELEVSTTAASATWTGAGGSDSWTLAGNWTPGGVPAPDAPIIFNNLSTANLATVLNQDFTVAGVSVSDPAGAVAIGGTHTLHLGAGGFDLSTATRDLTVTAPVVLGATQSWEIAESRTLSVNGGVSGASPLTIKGPGVTSLGAAATPAADTTIASGATLRTAAPDVLPQGETAGNLVVYGTLDLNGTSQSVNGLTGDGTVDNTGAGAVTLTIGNHNSASNFSGAIQETGGALAVVKTGSGGLTLAGANSFSGGYTHNGGNANSSAPAGPNSCFGGGPVAVNAGTLYLTTASWTFANELTLNGGTLRQGGGNNRLLTWSGPLSVTANSTIQSDGGTSGIAILGDVTLDSGATLTSTASGTAHTIYGAIGGTGNLTLNSGTLALVAPNNYTGTTLMNAGTLRLEAGGTLPDDSDLTLNGGGNFNVRNSVGWVYHGTINGDGTGQINLNSGTNAELAGDISGVANINANSPGTDTTVSGAISGAANLTVQNTGGAILRLSGANSYSGNTTISNTGTLVLAAAHVLPDTTPVSIASGTLQATAAGTETAGTLAVTGTATINLADDAALAFDDSGALEANWTGTLNLTGSFVPGSSLRFGTTDAGITAAQLARIAARGFINFGLNTDGYLTASVSAFDSWADQIPDPDQRARGDDADGDGFTNLEEFLFGTSPIAADGSLTTTERSGDNLIIRWKERTSGVDYTLLESATLDQDWISSGATPENDGAAAGDYQPRKATIPIGAGKEFLRVEGKEI